jgi:SAM-dependent methyltransferase
VSEFTGERVIPGQVEIDLWNEHIARYAFAARFAVGAKVLDIGCGSGYGAAELSRTAASVTGIDISPEATAWAREHFAGSNLEFITASAAAIPCPEASFDLITAFEVIEHIPDWRNLLAEVRRLLSPAGIAVISTPNKAYYTDSRGADGENPFHVHEFEAGEFRSELRSAFEHVLLLQQNRSEAFVFYPAATFLPVEARLDSSSGGEETGHFFVALCSHRPRTDARSFVYVPRAANVLRERERHIVLLEAQIDEVRGERSHVLHELQKQKDHLEEQNRWALGIESEWKSAQERIVELQDQFAAEQRAAVEMAGKYEQKIHELEEDARKKADWALETERRLTAELVDLRERFAETLERLEAAEATVIERTHWAQDVQSKLDHAQAQLAGARSSRWVRAGRVFGVGPEI